MFYRLHFYVTKEQFTFNTNTNAFEKGVEDSILLSSLLKKVPTVTVYYFSSRINARQTKIYLCFLLALVGICYFVFKTIIHERELYSMNREE